ncbi:MAG: hypothetical protein JWM28_1280 [Chitinophagaceae bacterium]|nr:hypothetical protein [Chitinophagaceae bacterium]
MKKTRLLSVLNLLALTVHISFSYATQFKLVNTKDVREVSDQFTSLFTPAAITFAIWGVIYIGLVVFCIYHIIMAFRHLPGHAANEDLNRINYWFILNNLAAAAWLMVWTHEQIAGSTILIFFQLITLIIIHLRTGIHDTSGSIGSKIFTQIPLSIYLGWITIATVANIADYLSISNWNGFGLDYSDATWTRIMIFIVVIITLLIVLIRGNVSYGLVILWALYGIILKLEATNAGLYAQIIETAWIGMSLVAFTSVIQLFRNVLSNETGNYPFRQRVSDEIIQ